MVEEVVKGLILASVLILAGCQTSSVDDLFCHQNKPIRLSSEQVDALTDAQARQFYLHNKRGQKDCGWKP